MARTAKKVDNPSETKKPEGQAAPASMQADPNAKPANVKTVDKSGHKPAPETPDPGKVDNAPVVGPEAGRAAANERDRKPRSLAEMGIKPGDAPTLQQSLEHERYLRSQQVQKQDTDLESLRHMIAGRNPVRIPVVAK